MNDAARGNSGKVPVRDRMVESANRLFYAEGIRAVSADRIIADVGTTKATFYRHFHTKDDLVLAYLESQAQQERDEMTEASAPQDPAEALTGVVGALADTSCSPGFRGCPFMNAAAEYPDAEHPVRRMVDEQRAWWRDYFRVLAVRLGVDDGPAADHAAGQLMLLRDGALFARYVDDREQVEGLLTAAVEAVLQPRP